MIPKLPKAFHAIVGLVLFYCALCPLIETALHSDNCIFVSGSDTESTVALLLLLLELVFTLGKLLVVLVPGGLNELGVVCSDRPAVLGPNVSAVLTEISPPLPLRI